MHGSHSSSPVLIKKARIEIIPLIDIMFFLLASFMLVSLTMMNMKAIDVNLPQVIVNENPRVGCWSHGANRDLEE
jgi:biopolymer transport protein ExbD